MAPQHSECVNFNTLCDLIYDLVGQLTITKLGSCTMKGTYNDIINLICQCPTPNNLLYHVYYNNNCATIYIYTLSETIAILIESTAKIIGNSDAPIPPLPAISAIDFNPAIAQIFSIAQGFTINTTAQGFTINPA